MIRNRLNKLLKSFKKQLKTSLKPLFLLITVLTFSFPHATLSQAFAKNIIGPVPKESIKAYYKGSFLPEIPLREADRIMYIMVSAYNSEPGQTDSTPFITAFNTPVRDGIIATNFLPKGTVVRFPDYSGDKEFIVEDRMNERYYYQMDIWMEEHAEAVNFGSQFLKMEIL